MKIILKDARMAFPELFEPKAFGTSEPACSGMFILDPATQRDQLQAFGTIIQQVAAEKWADKASAILATIRAKGDLCLRDGATKAEYTGFEGKWYVGGRNPKPPVVLAKQRWQGKPIILDKQGRPFTNDEATGALKLIDELPFQVKVPYSGCRVNVSFDVWAQDHKEYGKRVNAKILAVQFERDDEAFGGGAAFSSTDFDETSENVTGGGDAFGFGSSAPATGNEGFNFGGSAPDVQPQGTGFFGGDDGFFGVAAPARSDAFPF